VQWIFIGSEARHFAGGVDQIQIVVKQKAELDQAAQHDQEQRQKNGKLGQTLPTAPPLTFGSL
jgi:hypothetical protein